MLLTFVKAAWRPLFALSMIGILVVNYGVLPLTGGTAALPSQFWGFATVTLGAYITGRSFEKAKDQA